MQRYLKPYAFEISLGKKSIYEEGLWTEVHLNGRQRSHYIYILKKKINQQDMEQVDSNFEILQETKNRKLSEGME